MARLIIAATVCESAARSCCSTFRPRVCWWLQVGQHAGVFLSSFPTLAVVSMCAKNRSVSMVKLVIAATVWESAVHSSCTACTPGVLMAKEKPALVSMTVLLVAADGHYHKCRNQIHFSSS